ncbi:MAG: hypothetical protein N2645_13655 [Clostridia bacterium]|nr:hypothetical protein [Clostridia bacterium]
MKYYKLTYDDEMQIPDKIACKVEDGFEAKYSINKNDIYQGSQFDYWNSSFTFYYRAQDGDIATDYLVNDLGWPVISPKFREILVQTNEVNNVQYLPIKIIEEKTKKELNGYSVINILDLIDAIDLNHSLYRTLEAKGRKVLIFTHYALDSKKLGGLHLVRLKDPIFPTFISEALKNELLKSRLTGLDFSEVRVVY